MQLGRRNTRQPSTQLMCRNRQPNLSANPYTVVVIAARLVLHNTELPRLLELDTHEYSYTVVEMRDTLLKIVLIVHALVKIQFKTVFFIESYMGLYIT